MEADTKIPAGRWRPLVWGSAALLLLAPAVAMHYRVPGVDWTPMDFLVCAAMLGTACGLAELAARVSRSRCYRAGAGVAVLTALCTVWANLAVGLVGSESNRFNLLFFGVIALAGIGAARARLRAAGMAWAMLATAAVQALVAATAFAGGQDPRGAAAAALFVAPWLLSSALFRRASQ